MTRAEIIAIGTELLLGEISDTNTAFIAKELNKIGIDIYRTLIVGDNQSRITRQILDSSKSVEIVITTGGLGPTVDDPTRKAVADAFGVDLVFHDHLWKQIEKRFSAFHRSPTTNNRKQAYIPKDAVPIENPVGTAPAFYFHENSTTVICLPGVPAEMEYLIKNKIIGILGNLYDLESTTISRIIHTAGIGESSLDQIIGELEEYKNPSVGITAKPGQVDIRITAKGRDSDHCRSMIDPIQKEVIDKVGDFVYGFDQESLQGVVRELIKNRGIDIKLNYKTKSGNGLAQLFKKMGIFTDIIAQSLTSKEKFSGDDSLYNNSYEQRMIVNFKEVDHPNPGFSLCINFQGCIWEKTFMFGGHRALKAAWIENNLLNSIRQIILRKGDK